MTFFKDENGQSMVEYAIIIGLIAIVSVVVLVLIGPKVSEIFNKTNKELDNAKVND